MTDLAKKWSAHTLMFKSFHSLITSDRDSYANSLERFNESVLPPKSAFYNDLEQCNISEDEYVAAQRAWRLFGCKSFKNYTICYL